jgi:hypothetical protein
MQTICLIDNFPPYKDIFKDVISKQMYVFLNFSSKEEPLLAPEENKFETLKFTGNIHLKLNRIYFLLISAIKTVLQLKTNPINFSESYIPTIICSHEDKDDLGANHPNVDDINKKHDEHNGKELDLMVSVLVATVLEKMNLFMLQGCCNACLSMASANIICKCASMAYSVPASPSSLSHKALWFQFVASALHSGKLIALISYLAISGSE